MKSGNIFTGSRLHGKPVVFAGPFRHFHGAAGTNEGGSWSPEAKARIAAKFGLAYAADYAFVARPKQGSFVPEALAGPPSPVARALHHYFIRIGALSEIRVASALIPISRGRRVVVRSPRGVELAEIVAPLENSRSKQADAGKSANLFRILRPTSGSDELLIERLEKYKRDAVAACRRQLQRAGSRTVLLDVDQLLDGGTLVIHFLGQVDDPARTVADQIAAEYESIVRTNHLSELLSSGCGPDCGTGAGCGSSCAGCGGCGV